MARKELRGLEHLVYIYTICKLHYLKINHVVPRITRPRAALATILPTLARLLCHVLLLQIYAQTRAEAQEQQECEVSDEGVGTFGVPTVRVEVAVVAGLAGITDLRDAVQRCLARAALADVLDEVEACRAVRRSLFVRQTLRAQALGLGGALDDPRVR